MPRTQVKMNAFKIETKIKPADEPLQDYQVVFRITQGLSKNQHFRVVKLLTSKLYVGMEVLVFMLIVFIILIFFTDSTRHDKILKAKEKGGIKFC